MDTIAEAVDEFLNKSIEVNIDHENLVIYACEVRGLE